MRQPHSRRAFLRLCLLSPVPLVLAACGPGQQAQAPAAPPPTAGPAQGVTGAPAPAESAAPPATAASAQSAPATTPPAPSAAPAAVAAPTLPATPACGDDDDEPTVAQTAGPFYTPNSPERAALVEPGMAGTQLLLAGRVVTTGCAPVAGALVDIWQCDDAGVYDNAGFRLRGHQFADAQGAYRFETILPGLYPGRTRHIHVKVQAPGGPVLTTQLYFPDEPANERDRIFDPALVVAMADADGGKAAAFTFVLAG
jgi:protocatechuate 3,4-dioxygenase beta subunit